MPSLISSKRKANSAASSSAPALRPRAAHFVIVAREIPMSAHASSMFAPVSRSVKNRSRSSVVNFALVVKGPLAQTPFFSR